MMELLHKLGLEKNQSIVYLAASECGIASMTDLARKAILKRPTCYLAVEELLMLGLLTQSTQGKRKMYTAVHPRRLLELARHREQEISEIYGQLLALHNAPKDKPKIEVVEYKYAEGVRSFYTEAYKQIDPHKEVLFFANMESLGPYDEATDVCIKMLKEKKYKIKELNLDNAAGRKWTKATRIYRGKDHHVRFLPKDHHFENTDLIIFENKVMICSLKKDLFVITIESKNIADTYRALFEGAWGNSIK